MGSSADVGGVPPTVIPLRDGTELRMDAEGVHVGAQVYRLSQIQDARQVSPNPETIGLRVEGAGLVELVPARPGDAAVALEALYRWRPDLRPPVVGGPWPYPYGPLPMPPGYMPPPPYGPPPGYAPFPPYGPPLGYPPGYTPVAYGPPPYGPPPPGYPVVPPGGVPPAYPPAPGYGGANGRRGGLGPWPRDIGDVIGTTFRLYFENFRQLALLGLAVAIWPTLIVGGFEVAFYAALGLNPLLGTLQQSSSSNNPFSQYQPGTPFPFQPPNLDPAQIAAIVGGGLVLFILLLLLGAWMTGALALGVRESVLGRPVRVGAAARGGLQRLGTVLATELLLVLIFLGIGIVLAVVFGALAFAFSAVAVGLSSAGSGNGPNPGLFLLGICGAILLYVGAIILFLYFRVRLGLAPYAAASDRLSPGQAIGRSWALTGGNWWRTFLPVFVVGLAVGLSVGVVAGALGVPAQLVSLAITPLVLTPLITAIAAPLGAMAYVVVYYDLRLRKEGFPALAHELNLMGYGAPPTMGPMPGPSAPPPTDGPAQAGQPPAG